MNYIIRDVVYLNNDLQVCHGDVQVTAGSATAQLVATGATVADESKTITVESFGKYLLVPTLKNGGLSFHAPSVGGFSDIQHPENTLRVALEQSLHAGVLEVAVYVPTAEMASLLTPVAHAASNMTVSIHVGSLPLNHCVPREGKYEGENIASGSIYINSANIWDDINALARSVCFGKEFSADTANKLYQRIFPSQQQLSHFMLLHLDQAKMTPLSVLLSGNASNVAGVFTNGHLAYCAASLRADCVMPESTAVNGIGCHFDSIESALADFADGKFVVVVDDEDRENEGDLIIAAETITTEQMAFMINYTSGLVCCSMLGSRLQELELPLMVTANNESHKTAFTHSVDYNKGTTTGISAHDRAATCRALGNPNSVPQDFNRPGHMFPLRYTEGGVLRRFGHTEAGVDLCKLAGRYPAAVLCEIALKDGSMARRDFLREFANEHGLKMITIEEMKKYRTSRNMVDI